MSTKQTPAMLAARAERRGAAWRSRNAALFADTLEAELLASVASLTLEFSPAEVLAITLIAEDVYAGQATKKPAGISHVRE